MVSITDRLMIRGGSIECTLCLRGSVGETRLKYVYWRWGFNSLLGQDIFDLISVATQDIYTVQARLSILLLSQRC